MSLTAVHIAADIEQSDQFHIARLLVLLRASSGVSNKQVQGIMKLAKLDFLLRYPNCLVRALEHVGRHKQAAEIPDTERDTIEARMIRFRFGPWDKRYRRWIGLMIAQGLAEAYVHGRTVMVRLTDQGHRVAQEFEMRPEFEAIHRRSKIINTAFGGTSATALKNFIYQVFPEIVGMDWGKHIRL